MTRRSGRLHLGGVQNCEELVTLCNMVAGRHWRVLCCTPVVDHDNPKPLGGVAAFRASRRASHTTDNPDPRFYGSYDLHSVDVCSVLYHCSRGRPSFTCGGPQAAASCFSSCAVPHEGFNGPYRAGRQPAVQTRVLSRYCKHPRGRQPLVRFAQLSTNGQRPSGAGQLRRCRKTQGCKGRRALLAYATLNARKG